MKFLEAMKFFERGYTIRRKIWGKSAVLSAKLCKEDPNTVFHGDDFIADDWEVSGVKFSEALNALLANRGIRRMSDSHHPAETRIHLSHDGVYIGLGTSEAKPYKFTDEDVEARDWVIDN